MSVRKGLHGKKNNHSLISLQWIGCEKLVNDWADWVAGSSFEGPVFAFDSFRRQKSKLGSAPRPDNYPAPEPSERLRVSMGFHDVPQPASVIYLGDHTTKATARKVIQKAPDGCILIMELGTSTVDRECIPLLSCGNKVAAILR